MEPSIKNDELDAANPDSQVEDNPENVVRWLPVANTPAKAAQISAQRQQGRPRKIEKAPNTKDIQYHMEMSREKAQFVETDPVVLAAKGATDAADMLRRIKVEIAREAAALHFQRVQNEQLGRDTAQISTRRIEALNKVAAIEFEIKKLGADVVDLKGERFQRVFRLWFQMITEVAREVMVPEVFDLFLNRLETKFEDWEEAAAEVMASGK